MEDQPLHVQQARVMASAGLAAQALASAADAIVTVNTQGEITSWNPEAEALLGHTAGQAIGQTLAPLIPVAHRARHVGAFRAAMDSGHLAHAGRPARVEATTGDGGRLTLAMSLGLLTDSAGAPAGAVAVLRSAAVDLVPFVSLAHLSMTVPPSTGHSRVASPVTT
jgi:PAS domain S-box-containing protein